MGVKTLSDEELWSVKNEEETLENWPEGTAFLRDNKKWLEGSAPLWYYILKEAEVRHHGHHLGDVGSRIVAETLVGLAGTITIRICSRCLAGRRRKRRLD